MSYLTGLRLHFAGRFQAAPSTVNNDVAHYNNATFQPNFQEYGRGASNGWWNPGGGAEWRLLGCRVTSAWLDAATPAAATDIVLAGLVADTDRRAPAKIVDLDPLQQLVSFVWGMEVRICAADGRLLLRGQYEPAGFMDIWDRAQGGGGGDIGAGSMYQSVLTDLEWGDVSDSPFLQALQQAAADGLLSIKFNVDGYNMDFNSPEFTRGRVVGSIGPATADEPRHFVAGRQFIPQNTGQGNFYAPAAGIGFCVARFDEAGSQVLLDLGNALPTTTPGGPLVDQGTLQLMVGPASWGTPVSAAQASSAQPVGNPIDYLAPGWYERTAGVVVVPVAPEQHALLLNNPLALVLTQPGQLGQYTAESPGGLFVRADQFVFRADAGTSVDVSLVATRYGQPYAGATVLLTQDASQLQPGPTPGSPLPGTPTSALRFPEQLTTDAQGRATLRLVAGDPQHSRGYVDGQVYGVRASLAEIGFPASYPLGQWNFISLLLWDYFRPAEPVAWYGDLQPIFQQYANLYPVMKRFLDLANPLDVWTNRELLTLAFGLPLTDPNTMPVTRDLSTPKRQAILAWLSQPEMHLGPPSLATPAATELSAALAGAKPQAAPAVAALGAAEAQRGGKAAAAARRLVLRQELL